MIPKAQYQNEIARHFDRHENAITMLREYDRVTIEENFCVGGADEPYELPTDEAIDRLRTWVWESTDRADEFDSREAIADKVLATRALGPYPTSRPGYPDLRSWDVTLSGCRGSSVSLRPAGRVPVPEIPVVLVDGPMDDQEAAERADEGPDHGLRGLVRGVSRTNGELAAERAERGNALRDHYRYTERSAKPRMTAAQFMAQSFHGQIRNGRDAK